ncbi:MAG: SprT-like domain-containing protein [Arcobacteraceae bacterium]
MTISRIKSIFILITVTSLILLVAVIYNDFTFKSNPLSSPLLQKIEQKKLYLQRLSQIKYQIDLDIPVIISDQIPDNLFGAALYTKTNEIQIILNKNRFQENGEYMIEYVLPHEYAHALMFAFGDFTKENAGHSRKWQQICLALEGKKCDRYVKNDDILFGKVPYLK